LTILYAFNNWAQLVFNQYVKTFVSSSWVLYSHYSDHYDITVPKII